VVERVSKSERGKVAKTRAYGSSRGTQKHYSTQKRRERRTSVETKRQVFMFLPGELFGNDAAERPHINVTVIVQAQNHFRGPVRPRLNVGGRVVGGEARRPKVNQLNFATGIRPNHDVLGLREIEYSRRITKGIISNKNQKRRQEISIKLGKAKENVRELEHR